MGAENGALKVYLVKLNDAGERSLGNCGYTRALIIAATDITDAHALAIAEVVKEYHHKGYQKRLNEAWANASLILLGEVAPEIQRGVVYEDQVLCCGG